MVEPCLTQPPSVDFQPPNLVFVLDKSGSMFGSSIDFGGGVVKSFWQILHETLSDVVMQRQDSIKFGANWFPTVHEPAGVTVTYPTSCEVVPGLQVPPALNNLTAFTSTLPAATATGSGNMVTPAQSGYDAATTWINGNIPSGEKTAIVLFMDGVISDGRDQGNPPMAGPDCNPPGFSGENTVPTLTANIQANANAGVPTYVVGFFLSDPTVVDEMNGYAQAGGVPQTGASTDFYSALSPAALVTAFDQIVTDVATCDISVSVAPPFPDMVDVVVQGVTYDQIVPTPVGGVCGPSDVGWFYTDSTNQEIRLCGTACDDFKDTPDQAEVDFFCVAG